MSTPDRLTLPQSLVPDAKAELARNSLHAKVVLQTNDIFWQKWDQETRRDSNGQILNYGETQPIPIMVDDE